MVVEIGNTQTTNISFAHFFQYAQHSIAQLEYTGIRHQSFALFMYQSTIEMLSVNTFTEAYKWQL